MKPLTWDPHKNEILIAERGISFEVIASLLDSDDLLDIIDHPNSRKHPGQKVFVVRAMEYIYLIPFLEREKDIRLITIIPSRKAMKKYGKD
ncbi:MAG TPA: BrnT family toxin [bacterium]|jgi:uncharacterized DUF497 family protein|nr:BrnT family toxin [bacterium]